LLHLFSVCPYLHFYRLSFFFHHTAPPTIYTLSLHDALPISAPGNVARSCPSNDSRSVSFSVFDFGIFVSRSSSAASIARTLATLDRKSTRLNSSHVSISYAVFCLKKKKKVKRYEQHV